MYSRLLATVLFLGLAVPSSAWAHDPSKHKGKATQGEVVSVAGDRIELKTAKGVEKVNLTDQTSFEHGEQKITKEDLKNGDKVTVIGTTLASGEIAAQEVLMTGPQAHGAHQKGSEHKH